MINKNHTYKWNFAASLNDKVYKAGRSPVIFDGYMLDYLAIDVEITTAEDIDELIRILNVHKQCFITLGIPNRANKYAGIRSNEIYTERVFREINNK